MTAEAKAGLCLTFYGLAVSLRATRFNIQIFYVVPHIVLSVLYASQNRQEVLALHSIKRLVFVTEAESVYSAVRTECLYKRDAFRL
jgi:hypothetical protein